jgi:hypothetical protein
MGQDGTRSERSGEEAELGAKDSPHVRGLKPLLSGDGQKKRQFAAVD